VWAADSINVCSLVLDAGTRQAYLTQINEGVSIASVPRHRNKDEDATAMQDHFAGAVIHAPSSRSRELRNNNLCHFVDLDQYGAAGRSYHLNSALEFTMMDCCIKSFSQNGNDAFVACFL